MNDLIHQDLIEFVRANRPEVLPERTLNTDGQLYYLDFTRRDESEYRSQDEAAALLEHWLFDAIKPHIWYADLMSPQSYVVCVGEVTEKNPNKLSALWEAYKKVKGIQ